MQPYSPATDAPASLLVRGLSQRSTSGIDFEHPNDFGEERVELCADWTVVHVRAITVTPTNMVAPITATIPSLMVFAFKSGVFRRSELVHQIHARPISDPATFNLTAVETLASAHVQLCSFLLGLGLSLLFMTRTTPRLRQVEGVAAAHNHGGLHF